MTYESMSAFVAHWGLAYFVAMFAAVLVYALWPGNKSKFDRAARRPLEEE